MKIRKAGKEDAKRINHLKREAFKKINSRDYPKKVVEEYLKMQSPEKIINNMKTGTYFVLIKNNKILGSVQLYNKNVIGSLYIKPSETGKGYGRMLMEFIENYAKNKGVKKAILYPTITAMKFYERLGYKEFGKNNPWEIAGYKFETKHMEKKLK